jgi:hypothetical protein
MSEFIENIDIWDEGERSLSFEKWMVLPYLQMYECTDGRKVWFINQLDADMIAASEFKHTNNYFT